MKRRRGVQRPGGCFACFICPEAGVWRSAFCCIIPCLWIGPYHYYTILSIDRRPQNTSLHIEWQKENYRYILFSQSRSSSHHTDCTACWTTGVSTFPGFALIRESLVVLWHSSCTFFTFLFHSWCGESSQIFSTAHTLAAGHRAHTGSSHLCSPELWMKGTKYKKEYTDISKKIILVNCRTLTLLSNIAVITWIWQSIRQVATPTWE